MSPAAVEPLVDVDQAEREVVFTVAEVEDLHSALEATYEAVWYASDIGKLEYPAALSRALRLIRSKRRRAGA